MTCYRRQFTDISRYRGLYHLKSHAVHLEQIPCIYRIIDIVDMDKGISEELEKEIEKYGVTIYEKI